MRVLGLKINGHDTGAALIADGTVVAVAEERITREKHSSSFPHKALSYCLDAQKLEPKDIDLIVLDRTSKEAGMSGIDIFMRETKGRFAGVRIEMIGHHDSHAASAFFCSPFQEAAILVYDGNGDLYRNHLGIRVGETETMYRGEGTRIVPVHKTAHYKSEKRFPYTSGIGILYQKLSRDYIGFGPNNEGKMMGLAAYGDDSVLKQFPMDRWIGESEGYPVCNGDISFSRSAGYDTKRLNAGNVGATLFYGVRIRIKRMLGAAKRRLISAVAHDLSSRPDIFEPIRLTKPARDPKTVTLPDTYYSSVAFAAQKIFEEFARRIGSRLREVTKSEYLCVSGGCALNIDANRNFLTEVGFKDIFVQPASSDCGIPLGCALWGWHVILEQPRFWVMKSASLGRAYSLDEVDAAIGQFEGRIDSHVANDVADETATLIAQGNIIGWFQGGSEYGPRALGNRSIICDARPKDMRDVLNARVKHREMWRPFATSILAERLEDWFDLSPSSTTGFMLLCGTVHEEKRALVPSIVHVDNTCRMQTLTKEDNGIYYDLVKAFEAKTGTPLIINTSFNLGGDPIVESPYDAIDTFLRTDMDYLVLEDRVIRKATNAR